ncbi:BLOC-3 complex member HPS4-like isoform X5 [Ornithodoros turicata]|uniref:BLOC-3 complex member HPS4-like isoform X5 n=1 Tax=Ornithodoros turicata TaxID=34597 RepID=UPI0031388573
MCLQRVASSSVRQVAALDYGCTGRGDRSFDEALFVDDPLMTTSWDLSGSWNSFWRRLSRNRRVEERHDRPKQLPAPYTYASNQIFFVYDLQKCTSEESDPDDGIVYFYPPQTDTVDRYHLCLQLVGMAHFFDETFSVPEVVTTISGKYALRRLESYVLVVGGARDLHTYILQQQIDCLLNMFKFYHRDIITLKEACLTDQHFLRAQKEFWQCSLPLSRCFEDKLSRMFRAVTVLKLPECASSIYAKGYKLLEKFQEYDTVLAGSIFYKNKVLSSQLTPEVTQLVQLAAVTSSRFAMQDAELYNNLPPGTQLVYVYLPRHALAKLAELNPQSQSRDSGLHKYKDERKSSSESVAGYLLKPSTSMETPTDSGHRTEGKSGCESACASPLQPLPQSSEFNEESTSQETTVVGAQGTVDSDFISDFDSEKDLKVRTERPVLSPHISELRRLANECLRITEERMRQQQLRRRMRHRRRKVPRKAISLQLLAMTDEPAASSSAQDFMPMHETSISTLHRPSSRTLLSGEAGNSKRLRTGLNRASTLRHSAGSELGHDVCRLLLYVQKHCQMVCVALLENDDKVDQALITTLWSTALNQLGGIEAEIRGCKLSQKDSSPAEDNDTTTLLFNKQLRSFGDAPSAAWCSKPSRARALGSLHGDVSTNANLHAVSVRSFGEWIRSTQADVQETYRVTEERKAPQFLSPGQLCKHQNIYFTST